MSQDVLTSKHSGSSDGRTKSKTPSAEACQEKRDADDKGEDNP